MADQTYPPKSITGTRYKETIPIPEGAKKYTYWDTKQVFDLLSAIRAGKDLGGPTVSPEELVNRLLVEGRSDAGANGYNTENPKARELFRALFGAGTPEPAANFVAAMLDKAAVAKRLNISQDEAYNGTGTSAAGKTGKDYAARMEQSKPAVTDPKNAALLDYVTRGLAGKLTAAERLTQVLPGVEFDRLNASGDLNHLYERLAWNYNYRDPQQKAIMEALSGLSTMPGARNYMRGQQDVTQNAVLNGYRADQGVAPRPYSSEMTATEKTLADILTTNPTFKAMFNSLGVTK